MAQKNKEESIDAIIPTGILIASILSAAIFYAIEIETGKTIIAAVVTLIVAFVLIFLAFIMSMLVEIRNKIKKQ